jgi:hypothetical protein
MATKDKIANEGKHVKGKAKELVQCSSVGPAELHFTVTKDQVRAAPDVPLHGDRLSLAGEASLYDHYGVRYARLNTESGRRLARR